jgi:flagellar M-ring protein FliF
VNYQRALEGELEKTINSMRGIRTAKIHIVLPEQESYGAPAVPAEASVMLVSDGGEPLGSDVVKGIASMVASAVGGLTTDHVNIVDDAGRSLADADEANSIASISSKQMEMQREMESLLKSKTEKFLEPVVGRGRAKVEVSASLNFDRVERTSQTVNPDKQAVAIEQKAEIIPGAEGGASSTNSSASWVRSSDFPWRSCWTALRRLRCSLTLPAAPLRPR